MPQVSDRDINAIREWLAKETYLPKDFSDPTLKKFIFSCHGSLEKTKKCIEKFCTTRRTMPEIFTNRDPMTPKIQTAFSITNVVTYKAGINEILIDKLTDTSDKFDFYDLLTSFIIQADFWLDMVEEQLPDGHIIIFDLQVYTMAVLTKVNIFYFQKFLLYCLECMPLRLKQVHVVNCPPYTEYLYNLVKSVVPEYIRNMIMFHTTHDGLHEFIDKKYLPKDYGGEAPSMEDIKTEDLKKIAAKREFYLNNDLWKADLTKKSKTADADNNNMNGSFRSLAID